MVVVGRRILLPTANLVLLGRPRAKIDLLATV
jgi:hypothetical protein